MRSEQYRGLNDWARSQVLLREEALVQGTITYDDGRQKAFSRREWFLVAETETIGEIEGAWTDVIANLTRYTLPDGRVFDEYVQDVPWSSGPVYHIALKDASTGKPVPQSLWTDEELAYC